MASSPTYRSEKIRWRSTLRFAGLLCTLLASAGCSAPEETPQQSPRLNGPLSTTLDAGGNSVLPPKGASAEKWRATFGSLLICSADPVTLIDAGPHEVSAGEGNYSFTLRTVPSANDRKEGAAISWAPVGTMRGTPRQLESRGDLRSQSLAGLGGAQVDQPCGNGPGEAFTEILTTIETGRSGAWVDGVDVAYEADGREFTLPVNWTFVACGDAVDDPDIC